MTAKALKTMSVARALTSVLREKYDDFKTSDKSNFTSVGAAYTPHEKNKQTYGVSGGTLLPQHCRISYALEQLHHSVAQNASSVSRLFFTRAAARPMFTNPSDTGEFINIARADKPDVRESGQLEQNLEHQRQEVAMKLQVLERYLKKPVRNNQQNTLSKKDVVNFLEIVGKETAIGLALALSGQSVISDEKRSSVTKAATNACQDYLSSKQVSEMLERFASKLQETQLTQVELVTIFSLALTKFAIKRKNISEKELRELLTNVLDDWTTEEDFLNENACKELLHFSVPAVICSLVKHDETTSKLSSNETLKEIFQVFIELGEEISETTLSVCSTKFELKTETTKEYREAIKRGVNIAKKAFVMWLTHFVPGQEDEKFLVDLIDLGADIAGKILSMLKDKFELDKETVQTLQDVIQLVSGLFISLVGTYVVCRQNSVC